MKDGSLGLKNTRSSGVTLVWVGPQAKLEVNSYSIGNDGIEDQVKLPVTNAATYLLHLPARKLQSRCQSRAQFAVCLISRSP